MQAEKSKAGTDRHAEDRAEAGRSEGVRDPASRDVRPDLAKDGRSSTSDAQASKGNGAAPAREGERGEKSGKNGSVRDSGSSDVRASLPPVADAARFGNFSDPNPNAWAGDAGGVPKGEGKPKTGFEADPSALPPPPKDDTQEPIESNKEGDSTSRPVPPAGEQEASKEWKRQIGAWSPIDDYR